MPAALPQEPAPGTAPRQDVQRLQKMVDRLEAIGQAAGMGFWTLRRRGSAAYWGPKLYEMHGLSPDAPPPPMRRWLREHVHPDDRAAVRKAIQGWRATEHLVPEVSFRLLRQDGSMLYVVAHSRIEAEDPRAPQPFGLLIDVTEQRKAEAESQRSAGRAQFIARALGLGIWEHEMETGEVVWDEQMWRLRGREPQARAPDLPTRHGFVHPEDRALTDGTATRAFRARSPLQYEFRVVWPDGSIHWLASRSIAELDEQGRPVRRVGLNWDVTEAHRLRVAQAERQAARRELRAKSQFLSRMSHELRTPLNAVLGFAQLLLQDDGRIDAATRRERLEQIRIAGQHLLALINDVLDLSRLEGGEMTIALEIVKLPALIDSVLPLVEPLAAEHGVRLRLGRLHATAQADPTRLRQVLLNLLTNAIKYNRVGGEVVIDAENADGLCLVRVRDTGRGLTREQRERLFEPFNRLGAERSGVPGTGIGLAIVKTLVERMGGTVQVQSILHEGTSFELRLPESAATAPLPSTPAPAPALVLAAARADGPLSGRILYVEDNPINAMIIEQLVRQRADLRVITAESGERGLELARSWRPDLILLDMQLPDMSGEQVFEALRADPRTSSVPCVALSANALTQDIDRALRSGFADYWTKPLDFRHFHLAIQALFGPERSASRQPDAPGSGALSHGR